MNKKKEIALIGDPILRKATNFVDINKINSSLIQNIITELIDTMRYLNGAGLAANQIFYPYRLCVIEMISNPRYKYFPVIPLKVLINPKIEINKRAEIFSSYEGCLSVPNLRGKVDRYTEIKISYYNEKADFCSEKVKGISAVVYQHEIDHLDGVLFTDKVKNNKTLVTYDNYLKYHDANYKDEVKKFIEKKLFN